MRRVTSQLGCIQIDAVNVLVRAHYLPMYSRLGPYRLELFDRLAYRERALFEYLGHAASLISTELHPLLRWRMAQHAEDKYWKRTREKLEEERPGYIASLEREVAERGPLAFNELADPARREKVPTKYAESSILWWRWSDGKIVLDSLASAGQLSVAGRGNGFEVRYDLTERVIPKDVLDQPTPSEHDAQRELVRLSATALGVATAKELADYFRLPVATARARARELVEEGTLVTAEVEGWRDAAYAAPGVSTKPVTGQSLVGPFDSLIWERKRTDRIFGFRHVFELYVPPAKRVYGYYVLPFLLGERFVARVDLKADRAAKALKVPAAFAEEGVRIKDVVAPLVEELLTMSAWLGLERVDVGDRGDLARPLLQAIGRH